VYGQSFGDRIKDGIREHKTMLIQVGVVVAIAVIVSAIMVTAQAATKADLAAEVAAREGLDARASASINKVGSDLTDRLDDVEASAETATDEVAILSVTAIGNSDAIDAIQIWKDVTDARLTTVEAENSPPEGYLTGTVGNYTLHAECSEAGNFTANVHLVYAAPVYVGNTTTCDGTISTFYAGINWTMANRDYIPVVTYNGTDWGVSQVWFNLGTFALVADTEAAIPVLFSGLNSTYVPNFAYVEVWPVLK